MVRSWPELETRLVVALGMLKAVPTCLRISMDQQTYEFRIRILGNEVFGVTVSTTSVSNKWIAIALVSMFSFMTIIGAYGEKFVDLYRSLTG